MKCPSYQELTDYILTNKENKEIESHLVHCDTCMDTVLLSKQNPAVNNTNYKAVFAFVAASFLLFLLPYNMYVTTKYDLNLEVVSFEEYLENESDEFGFMWELAVNSIKEKDSINYIELFSEDDLDVFEL